MNTEQDGSAPQPEKKAWGQPKLVVHGTVEALTLNVGTKSADGITGSSIG